MKRNVAVLALAMLIGAARSNACELTPSVSNVGDSVYVAITLENYGSGTVEAWGFDLKFVETYLDYVRTDWSSFATQFESLGWNQYANGVVRFGGFDTTPVDPNNTSQLVGTAVLIRTSGCANRNFLTADPVDDFESCTTSTDTHFICQSGG